MINIYPCNKHLNWDIDYFHETRNFLFVPFQSASTPTLRRQQFSFLKWSITFAYFCTSCKWCHILFIFCPWLILLKIIFLRVIHVFTCNKNLFFLKLLSRIPVYMTIDLSSFGRNLSYFHTQAIMNVFLRFWHYLLKRLVLDNQLTIHWIICLLLH